MLSIAMLPILWTLVATQPMDHARAFQYRILAVTMLGGMYFWLMSVDRSRLPDIRWFCRKRRKRRRAEGGRFCRLRGDCIVRSGYPSS